MNHPSQELEVTDLYSSYTDSIPSQTVHENGYESTSGKAKTTTKGPESSKILFNPPQVESTEFMNKKGFKMRSGEES